MPQSWDERSDATKERNRQRARERYKSNPRRGTRGRGSTGRKVWKNPRFIALDGEGVTRDDEQHDYVLLAASDFSYIENYNRDGLSTKECFEYLLSLREKHAHKTTFISFSFGYDANMILRDIDRAAMERIHDKEYTRVLGDYLVKFIPGKSLYIGRGRSTKEGWKTDVGITVWDVWGFFQTSFVKALRSWRVCSDEKIAAIEAMKEKRGEFTDEMQALIRSYCFGECALLVELMQEFVAVSSAADIRLQRWDGAGAAAGALLRQREMKPEIEPSQRFPIGVHSAALYAYFGGRIEVYGCGVVHEPCYEYDINSAYPSIIAQLPDMRGRWAKVGAVVYSARLNPHGIYHVRWDIPEDDSVIMGPFPWRDGGGSVMFPRQGEGWYHAVEVQEAIAQFPNHINIIEGYEYYPENPDARPFAWVAEMYEQRRQYKETDDARGVVIKLALNAMYGKLAQSEGFSRDKPPAYQSYYMAGRVTAGTRAMILRAGRMAGTRVISAMTDALFTRERMPELKLGKGLGEWDESTIRAGLLVVQPGIVLSETTVYGEDIASTVQLNRSRGFSRNALDYATARAAWDRGGFTGSFRIRERRFIGMGRALASTALEHYELFEHGDPKRDVLGRLISEQWRRWVETEKEISFRANLYKHATGTDLYEDWCSLWPPENPHGLGQIYVPKNVWSIRNRVALADMHENDGVRAI